jgi:hypothetical protein
MLVHCSVMAVPSLLLTLLHVMQRLLLTVTAQHTAGASHVLWLKQVSGYAVVTNA